MTYMAQQLRAYDPLESSRRIDPETGFPVILPDRRLDDFDPSTIFRRPPPNPSAGVRDDGMSANDLQRQLNRGTVAAGNVADTEASISSLENERFTQPSPQPVPTATVSRPAGPFGGIGTLFGRDQTNNINPDIENQYRQRLEELMGQQFNNGQNQYPGMQLASQTSIPQTPPMQMAGGYGLSEAFEGGPFSSGVMSLPQIQDTFYSPPAGGYNAPSITSPYQMF